MLPYIIVFLLTILTTYLADKFFKRNHKILGWCFLGIGIFMLSFLAAVRDDRVGKDIVIYVKPPFAWSFLYSFQEYMNVRKFRKRIYANNIYICKTF